MLSSLPVIQDPWLCSVAVPAVLVTGLSMSGFGSLATLMMALRLQVPKAAAIMLPLQLAMDATGPQKSWRERDAALLRRLVPPRRHPRELAATVAAYLYRLTCAGMFLTDPGLLRGGLH